MRTEAGVSQACGSRSRMEGWGQACVWPALYKFAPLAVSMLFHVAVSECWYPALMFPLLP